MWYPANVDTSASAVVTTADVKAHCRVDHADDDAYISGLVTSATNYVESRNSIRLGTQTLTIKCDGWPDFEKLPDAPVQSVTSITYIDTDGATQTLSSTVYEVRSDGLEASIVLKFNQVLPTIQPGSRIVVVMVAGFANVPPVINHAIKLLVSHWYESREPVGGASVSQPISIMVDDLLCNHRRFA